MPIQEILKNLVAHDLFSEIALAEKLDVSQSTINRWINGAALPRADMERKIREIANSKQHIVIHEANQTLKEKSFRHQFDSVLLEIRESLHRRGRFASRNDALEELCKLLLTQIKLIQASEKGLEYYSGRINSGEDAIKLLNIINDTIKKSIPKSILSTISLNEFLLGIKQDEYKLLNDICSAFAKGSWENINNILLLDLFNETFGKFLSDSFGEEKQLGQYLTPIEAVRFMVRLAINNIPEDKLEILLHPTNCKKFGYILDPSCGVASFLVEFIHQLLPRVSEKYGDDKAFVWLSNMGKHVIVGFDKSTRMLKIAITHFAAIGVNCHHLYLLNSLDRDEHQEILTDLLEGKVALIVTNPPFGAEFKEKDIRKYKLFKQWSLKSPSKLDSELLFFERYLDWLKAEGNCIAVIPDSILTNKGIFQELRSGVSDLINLRRVISLPQETFAAAGTSAKTSIVDFSKAKNNNDFLVYFAICKDIGYKVTTKNTHKQKIHTTKNDLPIILAECLSNNHEYEIGRVVHLEPASVRWDATYHASLPNHVHILLNNGAKNLKLSDVAMLVNERIDPRRSTGSFRYIEISDVDGASGSISSKLVPCSEAPSRARKKVKFGDVLASTVRPEQKKVGIVSNSVDDGAVCTTGFAVIRPIDISSYLLASLLRADFVTTQLMQKNIGVAYPAVDESCFQDLILPITKDAIEELNMKANSIMKFQSELETERSTFNATLEKHVKSWITK